MKTTLVFVNDWVMGTILLIILVFVIIALAFGGVSPEKLDRGHVVNVLRAKKVSDSLIAETKGLPIFRTPDKFIRLSEDGQTAMIVNVSKCPTTTLFEEAGVEK